MSLYRYPLEERAKTILIFKTKKPELYTEISDLVSSLLTEFNCRECTLLYDKIYDLQKNHSKFYNECMHIYTNILNKRYKHNEQIPT